LAVAAHAASLKNTRRSRTRADPDIGKRTMSQYTFSSTYRGQRVAVQIGWDEPLQHYFMLVSREKHFSKGIRNGGWPIYSNLGDPEINGGTANLDYFWDKLDDMGIACTDRETIDQRIRTEPRSS